MQNFLSHINLLVNQYQIYLVLAILISIPIVFFILLCFWATLDVSKMHSLGEDEKQSLKAIILRWPIYGVIHYIFDIRPKLKKKNN